MKFTTAPHAVAPPPTISWPHPAGSPSRQLTWSPDLSTRERDQAINRAKIGLTDGGAGGRLESGFFGGDAEGRQTLGEQVAAFLDSLRDAVEEILNRSQFLSLRWRASQAPLPSLFSDLFRCSFREVFLCSFAIQLLINNEFSLVPVLIWGPFRATALFPEAVG